MAIAEPAFTLGVEEEYLLVDAETGALASDPPEGLVDECVSALGEQVTNEFLRAQVEIGTKVCGNIGEVRVELRRLQERRCAGLRQSRPRPGRGLHAPLRRLAPAGLCPQGAL